MKLNPYLVFNGNCEAAFRFYEQALGGKIAMLVRHEGTPAESQVPAEWAQKVLHVRLEQGANILMGSDAPPGRFNQPQGFSVSLLFKDKAEAERVYHALSENGTIHMPFAETFWSPGFGMFIDQFGTPWMVNCEPANQ